MSLLRNKIIKNIKANNMKNGKILKLFTTDKNSNERKEVTSLKLEVGGIIGDKSYEKANREILITSTYSYDFMRSIDVIVDFGTLGENILIDSKPYNLEIGTRLQCGGAILEISMKCPVCSHLSELKSNLPKLIKNERGIFGKVITGGTIHIDDELIAIN
jgi:MOSC domain-containing protein YiiM